MIKSVTTWDASHLFELFRRITLKSLFYLIPIVLASCTHLTGQRTVINLNGTWEITYTRSLAEKPDTFIGLIPVPGLVDMADAELDHNYGLVYRGIVEPNMKRENDPADIYWEKNLLPADQKDGNPGIFNKTIYWYKRTFTLDEGDWEKDIIELKINKSRYHTWVYVNKQFVGDNVYCFTPSYFDLKPFVNKDGGPNELVIGVGCVNNLPDTVVNGYDFEKIKYIPGIYDDVKLTVADYPYISNVQTAPDIEKGRVRVVAELLTGEKNRPADVSWRVKETVSGKVVAGGKVKHKPGDDVKVANVDFYISIPDFKLWSPESPFLYDLELTTTGDNLVTRFGMRSFTTCRDSGVVKLNGRTYYMRGTSICVYRFFEDEQRGNLPWDNQWVTRFHNSFKDFKWNSIRYCIGFPPDRWYEIADSLGFLIQDEWPIWTMATPQEKNLIVGVGTDQLVREYSQWMRQRWNHPSVVIWDAQNESIFPEVAEAINKVRHLDLTGRPWDNGWSAPAGENDVIEAHPYFIGKYRRPGNEIIENLFKDNLSQPRYPNGGPRVKNPGEVYKNPVIINEYGWIWLTRDGAPAAASEFVYNKFFPEADTPEKRFETYARVLAIKTEYWRAHRQCAGVMYLGALSFSRHEPPITHTADNWLNVKDLIYYPYFYEYMKSAFSPVGLMLDFWENKVVAGNATNISINLINDTYEGWSGDLKLTLFSNEGEYQLGVVPVKLPALGKEVVSLPINWPQDKGKVQMTAQIIVNDEVVKSVRDFEIE